MRDLMEEYGELLLGVVIAAIVFWILIYGALPVIKSVIPPFLETLMG